MDHERTLSAIQGRVRAFAAPFGFDRFVLFSASATAEAGIEHIYWVEGDWFGDGEAVDALTYVRHCPVTRHMLRVSEPFFWTKTRVQQGERYRIVRTPRGAACTACRSRCSAWPVWRAPSAWGRAYRRFTAGAAGAVAGGLGGLSGGAAAVRTGGRRGRAGCRHASVRC